MNIAQKLITVSHIPVLCNNPYPLHFENIELLLYYEIGESRVFHSWNFEKQLHNIGTAYTPIELYQQLSSFDKRCACL